MREIDALYQMLAKTVTDAPLVKSLAALIGAALGYVFPLLAEREAAIWLFGLLILDTFTGVVAAWQDKQPISSAKFGRVLVKILAYGSVIVVTSMVQHTLPIQSSISSLSMTAVLWLCLATEAISVLENVRRMRVLPAWATSAITRLLNIARREAIDPKPDKEQSA